VNERDIALGVAFLSLVLAVGWEGVRQKRAGDPFWQQVSEQWHGRLAQFFYFVGIPYLTVIFGVVTPRLLGLKGAEHFALINWQSDTLAAQIQQAFTLLLLEWLLDSSSMILGGLLALLLLAAVWLGLARSGATIPPLGQSVLGTAYASLHWTFYRAIFWMVTGDLYLGVVLGAALVLLEWGLIDHLKKRQPLQNPRLLTQTLLLILTATIFYYTPNWWLLFLVHLAMVAVVNKTWRAGLYLDSTRQ
jgi:hypothetical protein